LDVGRRQEAVVPTDAWKVVADTPGQVVITNSRVTSRFQKAKGVSLYQGANCATADSKGDDKRRSWLSMRPLFQGAVGFILSALVLQPLVQQLVPGGKREE